MNCQQAVPSDGHQPSSRVPSNDPTAPADAHVTFANNMKAILMILALMAFAMVTQLKANAFR
jgi:hypothetical protein